MQHVCPGDFSIFFPALPHLAHAPALLFEQTHGPHSSLHFHSSRAADLLVLLPLTETMAKKKKGGKKRKRVAAHIRENQGKRAAAAASGEGEVGADKRAPLLAPPLGVGKPKRPREPG